MSGIIGGAGSKSGVIGLINLRAGSSEGSVKFPAGVVVGYSFHYTDGSGANGNWVTLADGNYKLLLFCNQGSSVETILEHWTASCTNGTASVTSQYNWSGMLSAEASGSQIRVVTGNSDYMVPAMLVITA
jgi:hypothetical protein